MRKHAPSTKERLRFGCPAFAFQWGACVENWRKATVVWLRSTVNLGAKESIRTFWFVHVCPFKSFKTTNCNAKIPGVRSKSWQSFFGRIRAVASPHPNRFLPYLLFIFCICYQPFLPYAAWSFCFCVVILKKTVKRQKYPSKLLQNDLGLVSCTTQVLGPPNS